MQQDDTEMRIQAYVNADLDGGLLANCEECGEPIPVELTLCTVCYCCKAIAD